MQLSSSDADMKTAIHDLSDQLNSVNQNLEQLRLDLLMPAAVPHNGTTAPNPVSGIVTTADSASTAKLSYSAVTSTGIAAAVKSAVIEMFKQRRVEDRSNASIVI